VQTLDLLVKRDSEAICACVRSGWGLGIASAGPQQRRRCGRSWSSRLVSALAPSLRHALLGMWHTAARCWYDIVSLGYILQSSRLSDQTHSAL